MSSPTPSPVAGSEELLREAIIMLVNETRKDYAYPEALPSEEYEDELKRRIHKLITIRNDTIYTKVIEAIGRDETHDNGQRMVNDPAVCMECTNPDPRFCRNQLRDELRQSIAKIFGKADPKPHSGILDHSEGMEAWENP